MPCPDKTDRHFLYSVFKEPSTFMFSRYSRRKHQKRLLRPARAELFFVSSSLACVEGEALNGKHRRSPPACSHLASTSLSCQPIFFLKFNFFRIFFGRPQERTSKRCFQKVDPKPDRRQLHPWNAGEEFNAVTVLSFSVMSFSSHTRKLSNVFPKKNGKILKNQHWPLREHI